jgi:hypothetical protein
MENGNLRENLREGTGGKQTGRDGRNTGRKGKIREITRE